MNRIVIIAGAGDAAGLRMTRDFLKRGDTVIAGLLTGQETAEIPEGVTTVPIDPLSQPSAKTAAAAVAAKFPHIDLLVVNECECETLTSIFPDDDRAIRAAMEELAGAGAGSIAITLGARGSCVYSQGAIIESVPPAVRAVDTTCAGDTYIGALVAGYARGLTTEEAVALATKASALATTKVGAQQSIPLLADLD